VCRNFEFKLKKRAIVEDGFLHVGEKKVGFISEAKKG